METKVITVNGVLDLSNIKNQEDLKAEIAFLKESIKKEEEELGNHFRRFPQHAVKSAADNLLPSFLNKLLANGTLKLLFSGAAMFANPFSKGFSFKKNIVSSVKRLGLITLAKGALNWWSNQRAAKQKPHTAIKKPEITTLKTKNFKRS
jgi:hypothetical protein